MNLSIKARLFTGFGTLLALLIFAVLFVLDNLSEANDRLDHMVMVTAEKRNLSSQTLVDVLQVTRYEKNIILDTNPVNKNRYREVIDRTTAQIDKHFLDLRRISEGDSRAMVAQAGTIWDNYKADLAHIIALAMRGQQDSAFAISIKQGFQARGDITHLLAEVISKSEAEMDQKMAESTTAYAWSIQLIAIVIVLSIIIAVVVSYWIIRSVTGRIAFITEQGKKIASREFYDSTIEDHASDELSPVLNSLARIAESFQEVTTNANNVAQGDYTIEITPLSKRDKLGTALVTMVRSLRETTQQNEKHNWLTTGHNQLNEQLRGDQEIQELATNVITFLCNYLHAHIGTVYIEEGGVLELTGTYALSSRDTRKRFAPGEGLPGQVAREQRPLLLADVEEADLRITSSVVDTNVRNALITPFVFEGTTVGVIEIGRLTAFTETEQEFIRSAMESIAVGFTSAIARKQIRDLLEETQRQSEELQAQQEELRQINEELEEQAQNLRQQQEELQITNEELEEQTHSLEVKNKELEGARADIEQKSRQLEVTSKYKSEFLANMSHELRTPLNSLLILSSDLAANKQKNLTDDQVESAEIINKSGRDLLLLINEVLDLSKIEAGKMDIQVEKVWLKDFIGNLYRTFKHQAEEKGIVLSVNLAEGAPDFIRTDVRRIDQILKNLLSNALKFTHKGSVVVSVARHAGDSLAIAVRDTGIGIPQEKQMAVFEAFQQADGSTARKYGGTGLGLSISRELAKLLEGEITLTSKVNEGSTFTLVLPLEVSSMPAAPSTIERRPEPPATITTVVPGKFLNYPTIPDDRAAIQPDDRVVLVIEDDLKFASILLKQAHNKNFKCITAATGEDGLLLAKQFTPHAIILDLDLPGMSGHEVLAELKATPSLRHIPVHIISVNERSLGPIKEGAVEYLTKPVDKKHLEDAFNRIENFIERKMKNLLIVEDDGNSRLAIRKLIGNGDVQCFEAESGRRALDILGEQHIDCIVLDLGLPDMTGFDFIYALETMRDVPIPPIIIYTGKELSREENEELQKYTETVIIKGVKSEERLLDETALFLHRAIGNLPATKQRIIAGLYDKEMILHGKRILVVDDDMRNVFALSKVLKERGVEVVKAENGAKALEILNGQPDIDLVLMDIMMPEMDGYEAMRRIRAQDTLRSLPVIALTAKAMKDDRDKCIEAGANDYITKPVDLDRLLSLLRVWLSR